MGSILSIDFGTTNTVIAEWIEATQQPETIRLAGLCRSLGEGPPAVPSLIYINHLRNQAFTFGNAVLSQGLDNIPAAKDRLFRDMKRALVSADHKYMQVYEEGNDRLDSRQAAGHFLSSVSEQIYKSGVQVDELVLTVPVMAFEHYPGWLAQAVNALRMLPYARVRILDEPTAAAFGYGLDAPGSHVMVIDFGGGTLDLALVRLPRPREGASGGILIHPGESPGVTVASERAGLEARVIAKTCMQLGGADIDKALIAWLANKEGWLREKDLRKGPTTAQQTILGNPKLIREADEPALIRLIEDAKILLSKQDQAPLEAWLGASKIGLDTMINRQEFESEILNSPGLAVISTLRAAIVEILAKAEKEGIGENKIDHILLVGGTTLIPAIREFIIERFGEERVHQKRPFEAVAHGALVLATTKSPLEDYLYHSYAIEVNHAETPGNIDYGYEIIIHAGKPYPFLLREHTQHTFKPMKDYQPELEFVFAEIEEHAKPGPRIVYSAQNVELPERSKNGLPRSQTVRLLSRKVTVPLNPPGMQSQENRIVLHLGVDENRRLNVMFWDNGDGKSRGREVLRLEQVLQLK